MKKLLLIAFFGVMAVVFSVAGQGTADDLEKKTLNEKAFKLFQNGKIDEAIKTATKVLELERRTPDKTSSSLRGVILNVARMHRDNFILLRKQASKRELNPRDRIDLSKRAAANAESAEKLFTEAVEISDIDGISDTAQIADGMSELAWLTHNYYPADNTPTVQEGRSRIDRAETLYLKSLGLSEQRGNDADGTSLIVISFGNFYQKYDNYEKAMSLYERYIQSVERQHGKTHADLANALRPFAQILFATFQDEESAAALKRIEEITGRKEDLPLGKLDFHLRSKESVAFHSKASELSRNMAKLAAGNSMRRQRTIVVPVRVTVDETGKIEEAKAENEDSGLRKRAEQEIMKWNVRPYSYNGVNRRLRGYLSYRETF